jgi:hypothetical protein
VSEILKDIGRSTGTAQEVKARHLTRDIARIIADSPRRFQAFTAGRLVLVGGAGASRRSELAAIDCDHLSFTKVGLVIDLLCSKTD